MFSKQVEKLKTLGLMLFTLLVDFIWILYWGPLWNSAALSDWDSSIHFYVILGSGINIVLKIALIISYFYTDSQKLKTAFNLSIGPYFGL